MTIIERCSAEPSLASAYGQCERSVVAGDHGAGDRNLLAGRHDHDLAGADLIDGISIWMPSVHSRGGGASAVCGVEQVDRTIYG